MNRITQWFYGMGAAMISGAAYGGATAMGGGVATATIVTLHQFGISLLSGGIVGILLYLKSTPLPPLNKP